MTKQLRLTRITASLLLLLTLVLALSTTVAVADTLSTPISTGGVTPYILDEPGPGGNVTCEMIGYDFGSARVNYNEGSFDGTFPVGIDVSVVDDTYVEWSSAFPIGAVIVKGSNAANIYEYVPAAYGDSGLASPVNASGGSAELSNLTFCWNKPLEVNKTAATTYDRNWEWTIEKTGDQTQLTLSLGQTFKVNYEVEIGAEYEDSNWAVSGGITINNPNPTAAATIASVQDVVSGSPDIVATVDCGEVTFPYVLAASSSLNCTYETSLPDGSSRTNTATVATSGKVPGGIGTAAVAFGAPTNEFDECVAPIDSVFGPLAQSICRGGGTFNYSLTVGPYDVCGEYSFENIATLTTNDTQTEITSSWTVNISVPCAGGCTLTQGYWKTHSEFGPAPYDDTWAQLANGASTVFFLSGQTYYEVLWTPPAGNPYYILAHQYIAAELNMLNGASVPSDVQDAFDDAGSLLNAFSPQEVAAMKPKDTKDWKQLAVILDNYNNGYVGPGHCSEESEFSASNAAAGELPNTWVYLPLIAER